MTCAACAADIAPSALSCPRCHALVHGDRLRELATEADSARARDDVSSELAAWRTTLDLLPEGSTQHAAIRARVDELSHRVPAPPEQDRASSKWKGGAVTGLALLLWKFKAIALFVLTKGKLLALGLTKSSTLFSMLASLGVYWAVYGWPFAAGLIGSIYVHEMGHVATLRRFGIAASAPMFIPGFGALIRSRQHLTNPHEEARVGLAGPIYGLAAAVAAYGAYVLTGSPIWAAIGHFGAWVNLFNLAPVWQLDGAHAFKPLTRIERLLAAGAIVAAFVFNREGLLVILAVFAALQVWHSDSTAPGDTTALWQFVMLIAILAWMCTLAVGAIHG